MTGLRPVIGLVCCNELARRPIQAMASRFLAPLAALSRVSVLLVPALADGFEARSVATRLDGLLLAGSRSNVAPQRYGGSAGGDAVDEQRDEVALALAATMIEASKPVFGICRGLQELNVLFGGTLVDLEGHHGDADDLEMLFAHRHEIDVRPDGLLAGLAAARRIGVNSVHHQGIGRLGSGLRAEALATGDGLIEAISGRPCGADLLAVQWHPEWNAGGCATSSAFFAHIGASLRGGEPADALSPPEGR
jgi:putative glutamine amidotransferase